MLIVLGEWEAVDSDQDAAEEQEEKYLEHSPAPLCLALTTVSYHRKLPLYKKLGHFLVKSIKLYLEGKQVFRIYSAAATANVLKVCVLTLSVFCHFCYSCCRVEDGLYSMNVGRMFFT